MDYFWQYDRLEQFQIELLNWFLPTDLVDDTKILINTDYNWTQPLSLGCSIFPVIIKKILAVAQQTTNYLYHLNWLTLCTQSLMNKANYLVLYKVDIVAISNNAIVVYYVIISSGFKSQYIRECGI